jgi:uncharacterized protein YjiS (DUF1127 family)
VIADYGRGPGGTPVIGDGAAWEAVPTGAPLIVTAADAPTRVRLAASGFARSDEVWSRTKSRGERDTGGVGSVDRAGRVLRTPKVRINQGVVWHRVRGHLQIFTTVDSHVVIHGPLYGGTVMKIDTKGEWKWIRQDLRRDLKWGETAHVVHVEYAAIAGEAAVAEVVAAVDEPVRGDPLALAILDRGGDPAAAGGSLFAELLTACRAGAVDSPALAALAADGLGAIGAGLKTLFGRIKVWNERRSTYAELEGLDDRILADIGLSRGEIAQVADGHYVRDQDGYTFAAKPAPAANAAAFEAKVA